MKTHATLTRSPLFLPGGVYEVRILSTPQGTISGYFTNERDMMAAIEPYDGKVKAIYVTMNPVNNELLSRAPNRLITGAKMTTADAEIIRRVWILIDLDPKRKASTSSTEAEHQAAFEMAERIRAFLTELGWPEPIMADSGNGFHLLYKIELPNDSGSTTLIKNILQVLARRFDDDTVAVDTCVYNAARITKLYGTMTCKGPNTEERPHRPSMFIARPLPEQMTSVPTELLKSLAAEIKTEDKAKGKPVGAGTNLRAFIARHKLAVVREKPWDTTGELFELESCPFNPDHIRKASLMQFSNGAVAFHCVKESCADHDWKALRAHLIGSVLERLRALKEEEVKATWLSFVDDLDAVGIQTLVTEVARLTNIGINTLKKAVAEHRTEATKAAAAERIGDRTVVSLYAGDICQAATQIEAFMLTRLRDGECIRFGDCVMSASEESLPHAHQADSELPALPTAQLKVMTRGKLLPLVERAVVVRDEKGKVIDVPERVLDQMLVNPQALPQVSALITHPVVTRTGRIISTSGIDAESRLLLHGTVIEDLRPYAKEEACEKIHEMERLFLEGFEFATPLDRAIALSMPFTAVARKVLDSSPGVLASAAQQGAGKTTLGRRTHIVLTGTDLPVFTWPENEVEVQKLLFSALLSSPAIVCFDNVGDGLVFHSPSLAAAMTSAIKKDRILGFSRDAIVSTATFFILTGNNVELGNDEASRFMPTRLITTEANPHKRTFTQPDVLRHGLDIRERVLRHIVGVVAGYRQSTDRIAPLSRFPQWDALVRQPLIWAGAEDVGKVFDLNIENSSELGAHQALVTHLKRVYPNEEDFSAGRLVKYLAEDTASREEPPPIVQALWALRVKDIYSERSVGHALSRMSERRIEVNGEILCLKRRVERGLTRYWVEGGAIVEGFLDYRNSRKSVL